MNESKSETQAVAVAADLVGEPHWTEETVVLVMKLERLMFDADGSYFGRGPAEPAQEILAEVRRAIARASRPTGEQHAEVGHVCGPEALKALKERKAKLDADRLDSTFDKAERWHAADYCLLARDAIAAFKAQLGSGEQPARGTLRDRAERVWKLCIADDDHVTADVIRELLDTAPPQTGVDRERLLALIRQCSETDLAWADDHKPWSEAQATAKARAESRLSEFLALLKGEK